MSLGLGAAGRRACASAAGTLAAPCRLWPAPGRESLSAVSGGSRDLQDRVGGRTPALWTGRVLECRERFLMFDFIPWGLVLVLRLGGFPPPAYRRPWGAGLMRFRI